MGNYRHNFTKLAQQIGQTYRTNYSRTQGGPRYEVENPAADRARAQEMLRQDPEKWKQYVAAKRNLYNMAHPGWWTRNVSNPARQAWAFTKGFFGSAGNADDWHDSGENVKRSFLGAANNLEQVNANIGRLAEGTAARIFGGRDARDRINDKWRKRKDDIDNKYRSMYGTYRNSDLETNTVNNFLVDTAADQIAAVPLAMAGGAITKAVNPAIARAATPVVSKVAPAIQKARNASKLINYGAKATGLMTKGLGATSTGNILVATAADPVIRRRVFGTDRTNMAATPMRGLLNMTPLALPIRAGMYINDASYGLDPGASDYGVDPTYTPSENAKMDNFYYYDDDGNIASIPYATVKSVTRDKSGRQMMTMSNGDTIPIPKGYTTFQPGDQVSPGMQVGRSPIGNGAAQSTALNSILTGMNPVPIVDAYDAYVAAKNDIYNNKGTVPFGVPLTDATVIGASAFIPQLNKLKRFGKLGQRIATGAVQGGQMSYYPYFKPRMLEGMYGVSPEFSKKQEMDTLLHGAPRYLWNSIMKPREPKFDEI